MTEPMYTTDTAAERLTRSVAEAVEVGDRFSRAEFSVDDVSTILELLSRKVVVTDNMVDVGLETHDWEMFEAQHGDVGEAVEIAIRAALSAALGGE